MTSVADSARLQQQRASDAAAAAVVNSNTGDASGGCSGGAESQQPLYPPTPIIGHLTNEEIDALNDVFSRMEMFEAEESARIRSAKPPFHAASRQ